MTDVFADTYYFIAILSRTCEEARRRAVEATVNRTGRLVTTAWVLTEVANFLCESRHRKALCHGQLGTSDTTYDVRH